MYGQPRSTTPAKGWSVFRVFLPLLVCLSIVVSSCLVDQVCYDGSDCGDGEICDTHNGACTSPRIECRTRDDCEPGEICDVGQCVPDTTGPLDCPDGMVGVEDAYCIDRYEASRPDAGGDTMGADTTRALSRAGVIPWYVNPLSLAAVERFAAACRRSGKHLCTRGEWYAACAGTAETVYAFGDVFDRETCNSVDTFCDDYCADHGIPDCLLSADCGYRYGCFRVMPTGSFPACVGEYGALDLNGNVWEVVVSDRDYRGFEIRGGAFNCAGASERLRCTFNAQWLQLYAGFRCCWRPGDEAGR